MWIYKFISHIRRYKVLFPHSFLALYYHIRHQRERCKSLKDNSISGWNNLRALTRLRIMGQNNSVEISPKGDLNLQEIYIDGNHNFISIGPGCQILEECRIAVRGNNLKVIIGARTSLRTHCSMEAVGASILIGEDCMFSDDVRIITTDYHPIFDAQGKRLNAQKDVVIEDHVWLGFDATVLKGSKIKSGSVIGAKSLVSSEIPENVVAAGIPAKVIRTGVRWERYGDLDG